MRYLRFIIVPAVLSLVFAYFMPLCGITTVSGVSGAVAAVVLGTAFAFLFSAYRHAELYLVRRFARDAIQAYNISQLGVLATVVVTGAALLGLQWLLPLYLQVAALSSAFLGGFWLSVIGLGLTPGPALTRSYSKGDADSGDDATPGSGGSDNPDAAQ